jgi:hypothetical protein
MHLEALLSQPFFFSFLSFFCGTEDQTLSLMHAKQTLSN